MCSRYLYGPDGEPVAEILGFDGDGLAIILDRDDDRDRFGEAGEDLGPADPVDDDDEEIDWSDMIPSGDDEIVPEEDRRWWARNGRDGGFGAGSGLLTPEQEDALRADGEAALAEMAAEFPR